MNTFILRRVNLLTNDCTDFVSKNINTVALNKLWLSEQNNWGPKWKILKTKPKKINNDKLWNFHIILLNNWSIMKEFYAILKK